ncbi:MAG TPA: cytochrome c oxidase assembly protein [Dermatophilaceae bacterium]|nr:cytochrome c oxidase assembly protein [Dermatophilaceae bacterium]
MSTATAPRRQGSARPDTSRPEAARPTVVVTAAAATAVVVAALLTGGLAPLAVDDPGPFVRWGLPVVTAISSIAASATLGLLGLAAFLVPERRTTQRRREATSLAALAALVWAVATGVTVLLTFADLAGLPLTTPGFSTQLVTFAWELEVTRVLLVSAGIGAAVAAVAAVTRSRALTAWLALLTVVGVVILALTGHAAGSASHEDAVNALAVHLLGVTAWLGGLLALAVMRPRLGRDLGVTVRRYSVIATWAFVAVALSGVQQAVIRLGGWDGLGTAYGAMVLAKVMALVLLGVAGWRQRGNLAGRLAADPSDGRAFGRLALGELALMGLATGLASLLSRTAPPVPDALPNPSRVLDLTGFPDPGPLTSDAWLTAWRPNWLFLAIAAVAVGLYAAGMVRLRRRGDAWPAYRLVVWVLGWLLVVYATSGAPDIWGRVLFSVHMVMHMAVAMVAPLFLVPAAPITLALRAIPARKDRTWGPREVLLHVVHSRAMRWLANPVVAAVLFFASLAAFYWTPLFEIALTTHTGHLLMMGHFLFTGYLFVWVLIGIDPGPPKWSPLMLLVILFATISFHAFFGVALTDSQDLLAADFFNALQLPWGPVPLADQHTAGEIAWGVGEAPTLVLAVIVAVQWVRRDEHESRRLDRKADRDGDADLTAYNAYLAGLRAHDAEVGAEEAGRGVDPGARR